MSDANTTLAQLRAQINKFSDERGWQRFHDPKNLTEALAIEVGELMEHFLWKEKKDIARMLKKDSIYREEVADELADVFIYAFQIAESAGIDVQEAIRAKYVKNEKKYPVEKSKGKAVKYTKL